MVTMRVERLKLQKTVPIRAPGRDSSILCDRFHRRMRRAPSLQLGLRLRQTKRGQDLDEARILSERIEVGISKPLHDSCDRHISGIQAGQGLVVASEGGEQTIAIPTARRRQRRFSLRLHAGRRQDLGPVPAGQFPGQNQRLVAATQQDQREGLVGGND